MRHNPAKITLAWQILLGIVLVALSVVTLGYLEFDREREHLEQDLLLTVTALSKAVDIELETVSTGTAMLAASNRDLIERRDFALLHANLTKAASKARLIDHFVLVAPSGQQVVNTLVPFGEPLPVSRNLDKYAATFKTGQPSISGLSTGTVSGRNELFVTVPVQLQGETAYVFVSVMSASSLTNLLSSLHFPSEWLANIFDNDGKIVARTRDQDKYIGKKVSFGLQEQLARQPSGIFENTNLDNVRSIAAFHHSENTGFGTTIGVPKTLIIGQAVKAQLFPGLAAALAVFSVLAAWHYGMELTHRRNTEERFSASLANAAVGFAMTTLDGEFIEVNQAYCDLTGYSREEVQATKFQHFIHPDDTQENMVLFRQMVNGEIPAFVIENRFVRKDGMAVWVRKSVAMVRSDNRAPRWSFALVEDITDRKHAEAELEKKNEALERSNADLEQFAYVSSHDLQTPLRNIVHYTQLIERRYKDKLDSEANDFIGFIVDGGKRMTRLINDLLSFSRVSRQLDPLYPTSSASAAAQALTNLGPRLISDDVEVTVGDLPVVMAEQTHLITLFQNLLENAVRFRAHDRKLVLSVSAKEDDSGLWRFAVADNGIGIRPEFHDKIFDIFQQLNPAFSTEGTGIGLTICRRIVYRFGGNIWVESTPGEGATFFFTLADATTERTPTYSA